MRHEAASPGPTVPIQHKDQLVLAPPGPFSPGRVEQEDPGLTWRKEK